MFTIAALFLIGFGVFVKKQSGWVVEKYRQLNSGGQETRQP
jgi:hypothetical protein